MLDESVMSQDSRSSSSKSCILISDTKQSSLEGKTTVGRLGLRNGQTIQMIYEGVLKYFEPRALVYMLNHVTARERAYSQFL